jgi:hypothetical protein
MILRPLAASKSIFSRCIASARNPARANNVVGEHIHGAPSDRRRTMGQQEHAPRRAEPSRAEPTSRSDSRCNGCDRGHPIALSLDSPNDRPLHIAVCACLVDTLSGVVAPVPVGGGGALPFVAVEDRWVQCDTCEKVRARLHTPPTTSVQAIIDACGRHAHSPHRSLGVVCLFQWRRVTDEKADVRSAGGGRERMRARAMRQRRGVDAYRAAMEAHVILIYRSPIAASLVICGMVVHRTVATNVSPHSRSHQSNVACSCVSCT